MAEAHDPASAGVKRFNEIAGTWDENPTRTTLARAVAESILTSLPLSGAERAMEFGCGTGLVTGLLAGKVRHILAVDSSPGMLDVLRDKLVKLGIRNVDALQADLEDQTPAGPFDLIFSSMTLHHIDDVASLFVRLREVLAPGGRVALADLATEDGSFHAAGVPGVRHHGFEAEQLKAWLEAAGLEDPRVADIHRVHKTNPDGSTHDYVVQLATARRPA